jgi:predicted amidophosphoribosyltransferase
MKTYDATEQAYKNGYFAGRRDSVKEATWLYEKKFLFINGKPTCSFCNKKSKKETKYCCNCGAKILKPLEGIKNK